MLVRVLRSRKYSLQQRKNNLKKFVKGRGDVVVDRDVSNHLMNSIDGSVSCVHLPLEEKKIYLGFSPTKKSSKHLNTLFNKGLKKIGIK